jgi:peptidoglycan hydrolase-like protein with peptidoglycan-binding domain
MRLKKAFWGALLVSSSLGVGAAAAHDDPMREPSHVSSDRGPSSDDTTLAPSVPGVTEESLGGVSERNAIVIEEALAGNGYDPGAVDGVIDSDTRAAIREFQSDNDLAVTGSIDRDTENMLGNSEERSRPSS